MVKNDYRRSLILLRSNVAGYSGHVRLESRTMMGSMGFLVHAPRNEGTLYAALVGRDKNGYYACALNQMKRDARGQAALNQSFDPRDICGRELEAYQLIVVLLVTDSDCALVLFGNLNGYADVDWNRVLTAACGVFSDRVQREPVGELRDPREKKARKNSFDASEEEAENEWMDDEEDEEADETDEDEEADEREDEYEEQNEICECDEAEDEEDEDDYDDEDDHDEDDEDEEFRSERGLSRFDRDDDAEMQESQIQTREREERKKTAGERLGIDMDLPWPDAVEPLRPIFRTTAAMERVPDERFVYVPAPMPKGCGYRECAVGIMAKDGVPAMVSYALPSRYSEDAPAGLENYVWKGGNSEGWWTMETDAVTGEQLDPEE